MPFLVILPDDIFGANHIYAVLCLSAASIALQIRIVEFSSEDVTNHILKNVFALRLGKDKVHGHSNSIIRHLSMPTVAVNRMRLHG